MKFILTTFLALVVVSAILAQTGDDVADQGLQAGTELAQAIADKNFAGTMGKLATKVGPYLGMVGPVIGILFALTGASQDSAELQFMRNMLAKIENRFDQVDQRLDDIARKIDWNTVRIQFFAYEKKILPMKIELDKFYNASNTDELTSFQNTFTNMYECVYENSGQMLYNHIISGESTFSSNLLLEAMRANEYDRKEIQVFMLGLTKLVLVGSQIEMAYYKLKHPSSLDGLKTKWTSQMGKMSQAMAAADREVMGKYGDIAIKDAKRILTFNKGAKNQDVAAAVYSKLTTKFYWRNWFVAVYDAIGGNNNHQVWVCNGGIAFRHDGFNLLLASNSENTAALNQNTAKSIINNAVMVKKGWWMTKKNLNAKEIFDGVTTVRSCSKYTGFGVIRSNANFHGKADSSRLVTITRGSYLFFLFH